MRYYDRGRTPDPSKVSAVIVTRGNLDLTDVLETLPYEDIVIWDNSQRENVGLYGRFKAIEEAKNQIIYTQDDDLLVTCHEELLAEYRPGILTINYPQPWDIPWVSRGALFDRDLPEQAFARYDALGFERDEFFRNYAADGVFASASPRHVVDFGSIDLPAGFAPGRVSTSPGWYDDRRLRVMQICAAVQLSEAGIC